MVTNFAVTKDIDADRLFTWPRLHNHLFAEIPYIDLPDPSLFIRIITSQGTTATGAAIEVTNMFHNIVLPRWLSYLLLFTSIRF